MPRKSSFLLDSGKALSPAAELSIRKILTTGLEIRFDDELALLGIDIQGDVNQCK